MTRLDRAVLRSAVGEDNYPDLVALCNILDQLEARLAISDDGLDRITRALAEELVMQRLAADAAGLSTETLPGDTHALEDSPS